MRFCLGSDIHGNLRSLRYFLKVSQSIKGDTVLLAGDLASWQEETSIFSIFRELNDSDLRIIGVLGNSDSENEIEIARDYENIMILHGNSFTIDDINIIGISGIPVSNMHGSFFSLPESRILKMLSEAYETLDHKRHLISISHVPPFGILDRTKYGEHIGSKAVKRFIIKYKPDVHLCGHVHESRGIENFYDSIIINAGLMHKDDPVYSLEIDEKIEVRTIKSSF